MAPVLVIPWVSLNCFSSTCCCCCCFV